MCRADVTATNTNSRTSNASPPDRVTSPSRAPVSPTFGARSQPLGARSPPGRGGGANSPKTSSSHMNVTRTADAAAHKSDIIENFDELDVRRGSSFRPDRMSRPSNVSIANRMRGFNAQSVVTRGGPSMNVGNGGNGGNVVGMMRSRASVATTVNHRVSDNIVGNKRATPPRTAAAIGASPKTGAGQRPPVVASPPVSYPSPKQRYRRESAQSPSSNMSMNKLRNVNMKMNGVVSSSGSTRASRSRSFAARQRLVAGQQGIQCALFF